MYLEDDQTFEDVLESLQLQGQPEWMKDFRKEAWRRFKDLPMPHRKDEQWRFATIQRNLLEGFQIGADVAPETAEALVERSNLIRDISGRICFANTQTVDWNPLDPELEKQGVILKPIREAFEEHGELLRDYYRRAGEELGSEKFVALHQALTHSGTLLYVPRNVVIEKPVVAYHWLCGQNAAIFPRTLIIAEDNTEVKLVELFFSDTNDQPGFSASVGQIFAGPGSRIFRKVIQDWNEKTISFQNDTTFAQKDARVNNVAINIGASRARYENQVRIEGSGSDVKLYSLTVADRKQEFDQRTLQVHAAPNSVSDLLYKNALMDEARTIFSGLIMVEKQGQQTDAYQTNRNLLLDPTAEANSLPGLEILANDVKCSHGATTSKLDLEELHYLRSRGIPEKEAKKLLVFGFFEEIFEKLGNEELVENVRAIVHSKFARHLRA